MKKIYISQPMRGRSTDAIIAERKALVADAAVALQTDEVEVLDTYAVIFAPGWRDARGCRVEHLAASEYGISIIHAKG